MPSVPSSPTAARVAQVLLDRGQHSAAGSIVAIQPSRLRRVRDRTVELYLQATALLLPLLKFSKYGLGVALILCVTVIWVASSEWIQYIFGTLEYDKPFFLTYFNTTGFCLWNAGFLLSPRWRRTPWDEESKTQPLCVEDARLESRPYMVGESAFELESEAAEPVGNGDAPDLDGHRVFLLPSSGDGSPSANLTLVSAVTNRNEPQDGQLPPPMPPEQHFDALRFMRPRPVTLPFQLYAAKATRSIGATPSAPGSLLPSTVPRRSLFLNEVYGEGDGGQRSALGDNDDVDIRSDAVIETQLHMEDECRDYSLPTSFASSAREEVVSVMLTDDSDERRASVPATGIGEEDESGGGVGGRAPTTSTAAQPQEATRRSTVISPELLQHDPLGVPHRRRFHLRARRQRVLRYSLRRIWTCALYFCPLWLLANYLFNLSLSITSVASNTILSSTSSIWTLVLSYVMLRQKVGIHRIVAVALCVSGTIMVGLADKNAAAGRNTVGGDITALLSAFFYAAYTSVLKWYLPDDERFAMGMVFGAVGVLNFIFFWPGLIVLSVTGAEPFAWPSWQQFWPLLLNALIGTNLSDVLWARSVVLTSPVVATLGLSLTTPLAMVVDAIFKQMHFNGLYIAGAIFVTIGFLLANLPIHINLGV